MRWAGQGWVQSSSSDFQKSLKCFQISVCYFSGSLLRSRNQLSFLFYCLVTEIKLRKLVLDLVIPLIMRAKPALLGRIPRVFVVGGYFRERDNIRRHGRRTFVRRGWDSMVYGFFTNHSKPCSIGQKH